MVSSKNIAGHLSFVIKEKQSQKRYMVSGSLLPY